MGDAQNIQNDLGIVCIWWGEKYPAKYVERLFHAVNTKTTTRYPFFCLSPHQKPESFGEEIQFIASPNDYPGWWQKVNLFQSNLFPVRRIVYFDLDVVILKNIQTILELANSYDFVCSEDVLDVMSSSCMAINTQSEFAKEVHSRFIPEEWIPIPEENDQEYFGKFLISGSYNIGRFPVELHYSYKFLIGHEQWRERSRNSRYLIAELDAITSLNFHGEPNPHDLEEHPEHWKYSREILRHWVRP